MAASTWFHGSAWPPGNHGIMPSASCHPAMVSTVAATSSAPRMPVTSGSGTGETSLRRARDRHRGRLLEVQHQALADERVEQSLDTSYEPRRVRHVPHEEAVVRTY